MKFSGISLEKLRVGGQGKLRFGGRRPSKNSSRRRKKIANFVGADRRELVFSHNASYCLNLLAQSLCLSGVVTENSCVVLGSREHHANLVPWLQLQKIFGFEIQFLEIDENFSVDFDRIRQISSEKNVAVLSLSWVSNVSGSIFPVEEIRAEFGENVFSILDASQAVVHFPLDFGAKNFDAMFFSAHKIYAMTGVGALLLKKYLDFAARSRS